MIDTDEVWRRFIAAHPEYANEDPNRLDGDVWRAYAPFLDAARAEMTAEIMRRLSGDGPPRKETRVERLLRTGGF